MMMPRLVAKLGGRGVGVSLRVGLAVGLSVVPSLLDE